MAVEAVKFAAVQGISVERSTDLVVSVAYELGLGRDAGVILARALAAEQGSLTGVDVVQLIVDMKPYWNQVSRLTGQSEKQIVLDKSSMVMAMQNAIYKVASNPSAAKTLLGHCGLSSQLLTIEISYPIGTALQFTPPQWAAVVDRFQRGEVDAVFNVLVYGAKRLVTPN